MIWGREKFLLSAYFINVLQITTAYYCVDGEDTGSYWIPLDEVNKENTLKLILGSHKWNKLIQPTKWSNDCLLYTSDAADE